MAKPITTQQNLRHLFTKEREERVLAIVATLKDAPRQSEILVNLAPCLSRPLLAEALKIAGAIEQSRYPYRQRALVALLRQLPTTEWQQAARDIWAATLSIPDAHQRAEALSDLLAQMTTVVQLQAKSDGWLAERGIGTQDLILGRVFSQLSTAEREELARDTLAATEATLEPHQRANLLLFLLPHLSPVLLGEALRIARAFELACPSCDYREWLLLALLPRLEEAKQEELAEEILAPIWEIQDAAERAQKLIALLPELPTAQREEAIRAAREALAAPSASENPYRRVQRLTALLPHLPPTERQEVARDGLRVAQAIENAGLRQILIKMLLSRLEPAVRQQLERELCHQYRSLNFGMAETMTKANRNILAS